MRMKTQRILAALLSLVLLLALAPAGWAVDLDTKNTVNINLVPKDKEGTDFASDIKNAGVVADLYLIASAEKDPNYDTYHYATDFPPVIGTDMEEFIMRLSDEPEPKDQNKRETMLKKFSEMAQRFAKAILTNEELNTEKYPTVTAAKPSADAPTAITVTGLDAGLYLLILRGEELKKAEGEDGYITTMTKKDGGDSKEYGEKDVDITATRALSDTYEYIFEPQLITVPTKVVYDSDNKAVQQYNTAYGEWTNTLNIVAKPDWKPRFGDLKIVKTLNNYIGTDPATFVYSIKATIGEGEKEKDVFSDVVAIHYPVETEITIEKQIPVGAKVTVEEVYQGSRYEVVGDIAQETIILSPKDEKAPASVTFENKHNDTEFGGYGVVNNFTYVENKDDPSKNDWQYEKKDPMKSGMDN